MRILILTHKPPYTYIDGGVLAIRNLIEVLAQMNYDVDVISFETKKHPFIPPEDQPENVQISTVFKDTDIRIQEAFIGLFRKGSYNVERFRSEAFVQKIKSLVSMNNYDLVILESLFSSSYLSLMRSLVDCPVIMRSHNVEFKIWQRLAEEEVSFLKKKYLNHLCKRLKRYEEDTMMKLDGVMYISELDQAYFDDLNIPSTVIPFVREINNSNLEIKPKSFFHLGSMDWKPNKNGIQWLIEHVWPLVLKEIPDARLNLAGKDMPLEYFQMEDRGIYVEDYIANGDEYMRNNGIMLVPLFSGGGIRIKIIDGLCNGIPIISTSIGVEGIPCNPDQEIAIADSSEAFAKKMIGLLSNPSSLSALREAGLILAENHFSKSSIVPKLESFFGTIVHKK